MDRRHLLRAAATLAAAAFTPIAFSQNMAENASSSGEERRRRRSGTSRSNARNLQTALSAKNVDVEIVAYGPGIGMLSRLGGRQPHRRALGARQDRRLREHDERPKLAKGDMLSGIGYVGRRRRDLRRQQERWAYAAVARLTTPRPASCKRRVHLFRGA
jgi:hypothetical protein